MDLGTGVLMAIELTQGQISSLEQHLSDTVRTAHCYMPEHQFVEGTLRFSVRWTETTDDIVARVGIILAPPTWIYIPWMEATPEASDGYVALVCNNLGHWAREIGHDQAVVQASSGTMQMFKDFGFQGDGQWLYCDASTSDNPVENS